MKRLILTVLIALPAIGVNAAVLNWRASGIKPDNSGTSSIGLTAYLMDDTKANRVATLDAFAIGDFSALSKVDNYIAQVATIKHGVTQNSRFTFIGDYEYAAGTVLSAYTVVVNAAKDQYLATVSQTVEAPEVGDFIFAFDNLSTGRYKTDWQTVSGGEPVPEPTSGLLALLGVAGLALRRKRQ